MSATVNPDYIGTSLSEPLAAAYSLRKVKGSEQDYILKVVNSNTNTEAQLSFDSSGMISDRSVVRISSVGSGMYYEGQTLLFNEFYRNATIRVAQWLDQSVNARHLAQSNLNFRPILVNNGVLNSQYGKVYLSFTENFMTDLTADNYLFNNSAYTLSTVFRSANIISGKRHTIVSTDPSANNYLSISITGNNSFSLRHNTDDNASYTGISTSIKDTLTILTAVKPVSAGSSLYQNGQLLTGNSSNPVNLIQSGGALYVGYSYRDGSDNDFFNGQLYELMVMETAITEIDKSILETNQKTFYNISSPVLMGGAVAPASYAITTSNAKTNVGQVSGQFSVTPTAPITGTITITLEGGGLTGTSIPLVFAGSATAQTFQFTPTAPGVISIKTSNNAGLNNPTITHYSSIPVSFGGSLDQLTSTALYGFSVRRLYQHYQGYAMRIRNMVNGAEADLAFDSSGIISNRSVVLVTLAGGDWVVGRTALLSDFAAGLDVAVTTWYDQSGANRHMIQPVAAKQPILLQNGNLNTQNGVTAVRFLSKFMRTSSASLLSNTPFTINAIATQLTSPLFAYVTGTNSATALEGLRFGWRNASLLELGYTMNDAFFSTSWVTGRTNILTAVKPVGTGSSISKDRTVLTSANLPMNYLAGSASLNIGTATDTVSNFFNGYIQELVIYNTALNTSQTNILENEQVSYFKVPELPGAPSITELNRGTNIGEVNIRWNAPEYNGNAVISDYLVQYKETSSGTWLTFTHDVSSNTYITINNLQPGTLYDFRVAAVNISGTGAFSGISSVETLATFAITAAETNSVVNQRSSLFTVAPLTNYSGTISVNVPRSGLADTVYQFTYSNTNTAQTFSFTPTSAGTVRVSANNTGGLSNPKPLYYTVEVSNIGVLDNVSNSSAAAFSLRRVRSAYKGAVIRVKNMSSGAEADVYFDSSGKVSNRSVVKVTTAGGELLLNQTVLFNEFYQGATVKVKTWYDQSGNARHVSQTDENQLPVIVNTGVLNTEKGVTYLNFSSSYFRSSAASTFINGNAYTINSVSTLTASQTTGSYMLVGTSDLTSNKALHYGWKGFSVFTLAQYANDADFAVTAVPGAKTIFTAIKKATAGSVLYKNNVVVNNLANPNSFLNSSGVLNLGKGYGVGPDSYFMGPINEVFIFPVALNDANRNLLENNQQSFYPIPQLPTAPLSLAVTNSSQVGKVVLNWLAPLSDGNVSITDYKIEYKLSSSGTWNTYADGVSTQTNAEITGLNGNTNYDFRVSAINVTGTGTASAVASIKTLASMTISVPSTFGLVNTGSGMFTVTPGVVINGTITVHLNGAGLNTAIPLVFNNSATAQTFSFTPVSPGTVTITTSNNVSLVAPGTLYYTVAPTGTLSLDAVSVSTAAVYSVRRVLGAYIGPGLKIRNTGSGMEADVTFDSTNVISERSVAKITIAGGGYTVGSTEMLQTLIASGGTFKVKTWFDQSGNNRLVSQTDDAQLPTLITGGALYQQNGVPYLSFGSSYLKTSSTASFLNNTAYTINSVSNIIGTAMTAYMLAGTSDASTSKALHYGWKGQNVFTLAHYADDADFSISAYSSRNSVLTAVKKATSGSILYRNNILMENNVKPTNFLSTTGVLNIGKGFGTGADSYFIGRIQEMVFYSSELSLANRNALENNQIVNFKIPVNPGIPQSLTGVPGASLQTVNLSWVAPAFNGNSPIADYKIEYRINGSGGAWTNFAHSASSAISITVTGLSSGVAYEFRVSAVNVVGTGTASASTVVTPN